MFLKLNRFMTTEQVRRDYQLPDEIAEDVLPSLPAMVVKADGSRIHLESEVDDFLADFARKKRQDEAQKSPAPDGKPGRKVETRDIALFADTLKREGLAWKEIWRACREKWPADLHLKNLEQVRATWRRHVNRLRDKLD